MKRRLLWILSVWLGMSTLWAKKYEIRELQVRTASEYSAHQDFQSLVIAGEVFNNQESIQQIFDTKALFERGIMPVLVVVENKNHFAIRIHVKDIFLIDAGNVQTPSMGLADVLIAVTLNRPISSVATRKEVLLGRVKKKVRLDFEHKVFGEKLIAPGSSDHGIVFFPLLQGEALIGSRLYFPEIWNITEGKSLIFFEFELHAQP